jgi:hypothetical protein
MLGEFFNECYDTEHTNTHDNDSVRNTQHIDTQYDNDTRYDKRKGNTQHGDTQYDNKKMQHST